MEKTSDWKMEGGAGKGPGPRPPGSGPGVIGSVLKAVVCTPNRCDDPARYEREVIEPSRRIRKLWEELGDRRPDDGQIRELIALLLGIFEAKRVDQAEREDRLRDLLELHGLQPLFPDLLPLRAGR